MPPDYPGPLEVLEKLLASEVNEDIGPVQNGAPQPANDNPLDLEGAEDIDFGNLNLYYFALDECMYSYIISDSLLTHAARRKI
jgi:hypothetical protein